MGLFTQNHPPPPPPALTHQTAGDDRPACDVAKTEFLAWLVHLGEI